MAAAVLAAAVPGDAFGQGAAHSAVTEANNPLTPKVTVNLQNYYTTDLFGLPDQTADQFLLRGLVPLKLFGQGQLLRATLPVAWAPALPDGSASDLGDLTVMDLLLFPAGHMAFGAGPLLVAPTAGRKATGAGKWQAGAGAVVVMPMPDALLGALATYQQSFAGDDDRAEVSLLTFQPLVTYNLPAGFYLRSTATWNFNFDNNDYYIPIGLGGGKVWVTDSGATLNLFVEPQLTVAHQGAGQPSFQIFAGLNLQFPIGR
jgi:hypothetical protein